jgi:hypothetical protein
LPAIGAAAAQPVASTASTAAPVRHEARQPVHLLHSPVQHPAQWPPRHDLDWPALNLAPIAEEDAAVDDMPGVPMRIGVNRPSPAGPISPAMHGRWIQLGDEERLWRMTLHAPGAEAVRVHFQQFDLASGCVLILTDRRQRIVENYRRRGLTDEGAFWSAAIPGPRVYLELHCPAGSEEPKLVVDEISHVYRHGIGNTGPVAGEQALRTPTLLSCQQDVNCHTVDANARNAVGRMIYTIAGQGTYTCTGALLNDTDPNTTAGYFLTANHCLNTQAAVNTLTVYWFYETDTCNGTAPLLYTLPRTDGGTLLDTASQTDFTFIRLADDPADGQGLAAWTTFPPAGTVHGIHHPGGQYKRYSQGALTTAQPICDTRPLTYYYYLDWTLGITEGGSSGSPLFNDNWEVVGQLFGICRFSGTTAGCSNPEDFNALHGKFAYSYTFYDVSTYLNLITPDDAYEDNDDLASAPLLAGGEHNLILVDFDDYFSFEVNPNTTVTVTASFLTSDMNLDLELLTTGGALLDSSTSTFLSTETVSAAVSPGTYIVHAIKARKWGGPYSLTIAFAPTKPIADYDDDGDVDMIDFAFLQRCFSGDGVPVISPECDDAPLDGDNDVDPADVAVLFDCFSGPNVPAAIDCGL